MENRKKIREWRINDRIRDDISADAAMQHTQIRTGGSEGWIAGLSI